jgi:hypothetical protein
MATPDRRVLNRCSLRRCFPAARAALASILAAALCDPATACLTAAILTARQRAWRHRPICLAQSIRAHALSFAAVLGRIRGTNDT